MEGRRVYAEDGVVDGGAEEEEDLRFGIFAAIFACIGWEDKRAWITAGTKMGLEVTIWRTCVGVCIQAQ